MIAVAASSWPVLAQLMQSGYTVDLARPTVTHKECGSVTADSDPASRSKAAPAGYVYAGAWIRFGALLIDSLLLWAVVYGLVAFVHISGVGPLHLQGAVAFVVVTGVMVGWFAGWQAAAGATPGMILLGLRVRGPSGEDKPSLLASVIRNSLWLIPNILAAVFSGHAIGTTLESATTLIYVVIGITIAKSPTHQGIHDRLAGGTYVLRRAPAPTSTL